MCLLRALQDQCDGGRHLLPVRHLPFELLAAGFGQGVELGAAILFRGAPLCADPFLAFQAIERRVERTLLDLQDVARDLLDALGDAPAVHGFERQSFQDQKIERALQDFDPWTHGLSPRRTTSGISDSSCRLSRGSCDGRTQGADFGAGSCGLPALPS